MRHLSLLEKEERISPAELKNWQENTVPHVIVDVRSSNEFEMCSVPDSINIPLAELDKNENIDQLKNIIQTKRTNSCDIVNGKNMFICSVNIKYSYRYSKLKITNILF